MGGSVTHWKPNVLDDAANDTMELTVDTTSEEVFSTMRTVVPVDSEELRNGLHLRRVSAFESIIDSDADHTMMVLEGTDPHTIKPKRGKALSFYWDRVGAVTIWRGDLDTPATGPSGREFTPGQRKLLFARWAESEGMVPIFAWPNHPGTESNDFVKRTLEIEQPRIDGDYFAQAASTVRRRYS
jgi:hypothetical protein